MRKLKAKFKYGKNGITLITLVITIIVLLILSGVTIATLTKENGIFTRTQQAKIRTEEAQEKEGLGVAVTSSQLEDVNTLKIKKENLENAIKQQFGNNKNFSVTDNKDGSFLVNMNDTQRMYYIDETGQIIDQNKILRISTANELKVFRDNVNRGNTYEDWYIYLANDLNLDINEEWKPIGLYPMENSTPDAQTNKPFKGTFDGRNHEINGMYINTTDKVQGLFGLVIGGKILNLGIGRECNILGDLSIGAIAGYLYNGAKAINCYNKSDLKVGAFSGGVFGQIAINCNIENCYNIGNINISNDSKYTGGVVGNVNLNSSLKKCYNEGNVYGNIIGSTYVLGGVTGNLSDDSLLEECFNIGKVQGNDRIGGIAGLNVRNGNMQNCYNVGIIEGNNKIGGISGQSTSSISNCYNVGKIKGTTIFGGIVGANLVSKDYQTEGVLRNTYILENTCENICGYNDSTIEDSSIKSKEEMKLLVSTLGEAFKEDINNINNGFPILTWQNK